MSGPGYAPFTGFGDDTNTSAKFTILMNNDEAPEWRGGERILSYHDMGNGQTTVQRHGWTPITLTCLLDLENSAALELLTSLQGESATLRYLFGITQRASGEKWTDGGGIDYLVLPDTLLLSVVPSRNDGVIDGPREATATFWRPYVPSPYVGFTVVGSDE